MSTHYEAFISYAHNDERWAKWLQRALERYRVPSNLNSQRSGGKPSPKRLHPIFRDRDELASASDLSASIRSALDCSHALIVVCSPAAAQSKWVGEEIRHFQATDRSARIFCLLVSGTTERGHPDCAFPPALLQSVDGDPLPDPLAADVTDKGDGKRDAMLRIAAGLLGVGIDDLKHRDAQRQLRLRGAVAMGSLAVTVLTVGFAIVAQLAREEADLRRGQAEGLISFMIGDLRSKLEPLSRLDLLEDVGDETMDYFTALGDAGTEQEVYSRAMAMRQIGEVRIRQGRLAGAQQAFEESRKIAESLFTSAPENNDYLYELSQAEYWVGLIALEQSQPEQTEASFTKYMEYTRQLLSREPENSAYQLELVYAYGNLVTVAIEARDPQRALEYSQQSVDLNQILLAAAPENLYLRHVLGGGYSWVGKSQLLLGHLEESETAYLTAFEGLAELHATGEDRVYSENYGQNAYHLGDVHLNQGHLTEAELYFGIAFQVFTELVALDPDNAIWRDDLVISARHQAEVLMLADRRTDARDLLEQAIADFKESVSTDSGELGFVASLALAERLLALLLLDDSPEQALELITQAQLRIIDVVDNATVRARVTITAGIVAETYGRILWQSGNEAAAIATWNRALELLQPQSGSELSQLAVARQLVFHLQGESAAALRATRLEEAGFDDPRFRLQP